MGPAQLIAVVALRVLKQEWRRDNAIPIFLQYC